MQSHEHRGAHRHLRHIHCAQDGEAAEALLKAASLGEAFDRSFGFEGSGCLQFDLLGCKAPQNLF